MSDDAPKRVNILPGYAKRLPTTEGRYVKGVWYILEDHAQAEKEAAVAAESEANAMIADEWYSLMEKHGLKHHEDSENRSRCFAKARQAMYIAQDIRARGNTDALERVRQEAKAEALREAAELVTREGFGAVHDKILSLIPDQHKVDG